MALVEYSDSESDADIAAASPPPTKKPRHSQQASALPPLPATFHDLYASSTRVSVQDDPSLHGGRKRVIPHVEGNWPTHIYLECTGCPFVSVFFRFFLSFANDSRVPIYGSTKASGRPYTWGVRTQCQSLEDSNSFVQ